MIHLGCFSVCSALLYRNNNSLTLKYAVFKLNYAGCTWHLMLVDELQLTTLIGGIFVLKSGLRFLFRALEVSIQKVRKSHFLSWKRVFSSLSEWALPMPETKIWDHFSIQIYPLLVGNMASETTFGRWKVVFSWGKVRKMSFSQKFAITQY